MTIERKNVGKRLSGLVIHRTSGTAYLSGQVPDDLTADVAGQTRQVLAHIDRLLAEAGTDKSKILSANIWLTDIGTWSQMNEVWDAWVSPGNTPARATVEAKLANPALKVEIMVQAALS
jgi:enamine deaminase RidA (YjgF/YER057c/UK114 family)